MKSFVRTSSIVAFKYENGTIHCTDKKGHYGHLKKLNTLTRTFKINNSLISYAGEYSDIQSIHGMILHELEKTSRVLNAKGLHSLVQRILYTSRSRLKPLNVFAVISDKDFLGAVNHLGSFFEDDVICEGIGSYLITPFLRSKEKKAEEALDLMEEAMRILIYRDCWAGEDVVVGIAEEGRVDVSERKIETDWEIGRNVDD